MDPIATDLPNEIRQAYERYLKIPVADKATLKNKLEAYMTTVLNASGENEFLDYPTAQKLNMSLLKLLDACSIDQLPQVQAAVIYFISADDASPDLESILGFDDDAQVVNAVCCHLGHPQLAVSL